MVLAGKVLMQLGSQERAVSDGVKEVIRILKKTQPAQVPQVCIPLKCVRCAQTHCSCRCLTASSQCARLPLHDAHGWAEDGRVPGQRCCAAHIDQGSLCKACAKQSAHRAARLAQMHVAALREAYQAAVAAEGDAQGDALQLFGELGQRVAASYAGFMSGAAAALLQIVKGGIDYALQVTLPLITALICGIGRCP